MNNLPFRSPLRSALALTLLFPATLQAFEEQFTDQVIVLPKRVALNMGFTQDPLGPGEGNWNCIDVRIAEQLPGLRVIMPNDQSGDPERIREVLRVAKDLVPHAVLNAGGAIQAAYEAGILYGVDLHVFPHNPVVLPTPPETIGTRGVIQEPQDDTLVTLGYVYCFTQAQYEARTAAIAAMMNVSGLAQETIWLGGLARASDSGDFSLRVVGTRNVAWGDLLSQGTVRVLGSEHDIVDFIGWTTNLVVGGAGHEIGDSEQLAAAPAPALPARTLSAYAALAAGGGTYYASDVLVTGDASGVAYIDGTPVSGLIYSTGIVRVEADDGINGAFTFIGERGVQFYANGANVTPAVDDLFAWAPGTTQPTQSEDNCIRLEGRLNTLTGAAYAPLGDLDVVTLSSTLVGRYAAAKVRLGGAENQFSDGTAP